MTIATNGKSPSSNEVPVRILVADDHELFLDGVKALLETATGFDVVGTAANGDELWKLYEQHKVDVILTDLRMPGLSGLEFIRKVRETSPLPHILVLSSFESNHAIVDALEAGANGFLVKTAGREEVLEAIHTVMAYEPYYCRSTSRRLAKLIAASRFNPYKPASLQLFSETEQKVIRLICEEYSTAEMSDLLCLGKRTIDGYRADILFKMNVKTAAGVAIYAVKHGLYEFE